MQTAAALHERSTIPLRLLPQEDTFEPARIVPAAHKRSPTRLQGLQVVLKHSVALAAVHVAIAIYMGYSVHLLERGLV